MQKFFVFVFGPCIQKEKRTGNKGDRIWANIVYQGRGDKVRIGYSVRGTEPVNV